MNITLNGKKIALLKSETIEDVLKELGYENPFIAVSLNHTCIPKKSFSSTGIKENDIMEIVAPMAGG